MGIPIRHIGAMLGLCGIAQLACVGPASASVISASPTLPVLGVPYTSSVGVGCFPTAGVCITSGALLLTSVVSSTFSMSGQDIIANAAFSGKLTTLGGMKLGMVALTGSAEEEVLGRTFSIETCTWTTDLLALSLSGPVLGHMLTLDLDISNPSTGVTSILPAGIPNEGLFRIDSFFDIFVDLTLDSVPPLHTGRGPLPFTLGPVLAPEPASGAILAAALLTLAVTRRRARRAG